MLKNNCFTDFSPENPPANVLNELWDICVYVV